MLTLKYIHLYNNSCDTCSYFVSLGSLVIIDPEEEFWPEEVSKLSTDVRHNGLSLLIFAGWFNTSVQNTLKFYDANNRLSV